ncbi:hypothetical protein GGS24DRAFT_499966 [Hypoxylon argillaceum]|nr:hypothetical protein GGS24DRAFT_499966 [Hypoxylon argillaceum]
MSPMSRNNSAVSLMGFSVHQPAIGAPLQFFPAMGTQQLDEMIDAYVPGDASILDKRAAVSMEFFEYAMMTGDLFKFFMVYPTLGSTSTSPTMNSSTSPAMSESQWGNPSPRMVSPSSSKKTTSPNDFCNLPGMKIMTKDGRDVTNSASRGCKTKEQRDHAHLMRIIKACDSCKRKKTKCDPSHKRSSAGTTSGKIAKKASKNSRPAAAPPQMAAKQASVTPELDQIFSGSSESLDSFFAESMNAPADAFSMEWDQFIQYDEEPTEMIPYDYNFLLDPASYFSPATTVSFSSSSTSPSQLPITPRDRDVNIADGVLVGHDHKPLLPYLDPAGLEAGSNYVDFNLYSPSSSSLDEELDLAREVAASPIQPQRLDHYYHRHIDTRQETTTSATPLGVGNNVAHIEPVDSYQRNAIIGAVEDSFAYNISNYMLPWSESTAVAGATSQAGVLDPWSSGLSSSGQATPSNATVNTIPAGLPIVDNVLEAVTSEGLYGRETIHRQARLRSLSNHRRSRSPSALGTAASTAARLHEGLAALHGSVNSVPHTQSPSTLSSVIRSCGQDELSSAKRSVINTAAGGLSTPRIRGQQPDEFHVVHRIGSTTTSQSATYRDPGAEPPSPTPTPLPSPTPSSVMVTSSLDVKSKSSPSSLSSLLTPKPKKRVTGVPIYTNAKHSLAGRDRSSALPWTSGSEHQNPAGTKNNLSVMSSDTVSSDALQAISVIARPGIPPVVISPASTRATITKSNNMIGDAQSAGPEGVARCITSMVLFFMALYQLWSLISSFSIVPLPVGYCYTQLRQHTSSPTARQQLSASSPSHKLACLNQFLIDTTDSFKFSYAKILHVVQCDLARKLKPWTRSEVTPIAKASHQKLSRRLGGKAVMPLTTKAQPTRSIPRTLLY